MARLEDELELLLESESTLNWKEIRDIIDELSIYKKALLDVVNVYDETSSRCFWMRKMKDIAEKALQGGKANG